MFSIEERQEQEEEAEESRARKETLRCTGDLCRGEVGTAPGGSEARWAEKPGMSVPGVGILFCQQSKATEGWT